MINILRNVLIVSAKYTMLPSVSCNVDVGTNTSRALNTGRASNTGRGSDITVLIEAGGLYSRKYGKQQQRERTSLYSLLSVTKVYFYYTSRNKKVQIIFRMQVQLCT